MADFGDPSTWEMNVDQFIDSGLPKEKPQELLDLQEQNRKQRLLQSLQKIGPRLEDSSLDFINRENFSEGTPTGYTTRKQLAEKLGISPFTIERAKVENSRLYQKIKELMNISKEGTTTKPEYYKPKKETLNSVIKEIKKFSGVAAQKLPREEYRGKKTTLSQVKDVLNKSDKPLDIKELSKKLPDLNRATIRTSLNVLKNDKKFKNKIGFVSPTASALEGAQTKATKIAPIMNTLRDQFVLDPDSDVVDIAKAMVGDKKFNASNNVEKQKYLKDASRQVSKFVSQFSTGATKTTPGFKNIDPDKLGDILDSIEARTNDFGFESGTLRQLRFAIADAKRGLAERTTEKLRSRVSSKGKAVDEVVGTAATFEKAPGYIEATQVIDSEVNQIKGRKLDPEFSRVFNQSLNGNFSGVNKYNKKAKAFGKKYKIDVPIIKTGSNLKPEKIISNFKDFTSSGQKNIKEIAKEKGIVVQTKSKPLQALAAKFKPGMQPDGQLKDFPGGNEKGFLGGSKAAKAFLKSLQLLGQPSIAAGFGVDELRKGNIKTAGSMLLAPEFVGSFAPAGKGILSTIGRVAANPFGKAVRAFTPVGLATIAGGAGYDVYKEIKRRQELTDEERLQEDIEAQAKYDEMMVGAAEGGRIGFADGDDPNNPGRRKFMKLAAGLASLPILGKFFKVAEKTAPLVQQIKNSSTAMPDWFPNFVDKFIGRSIGKKIDADFMEYTNPDLPNIKLSKSDDGKILVEGTNEYNEAYNISYEPPGYEVLDYKTGKTVKTKGEFEAVEGRQVALGPEDYDTDPFYAEDLDELFTSDIAKMEKYTTGNISKTVKDAFGKETGLKRGKYDVDMAQGQAENRADILRDEGLDEID